MLLPLLSLALPFHGLTPELQDEQRSSRIAWLAEHASRLRTLDLEDDDFGDLDALGEAIAGKRVVMLGEQTHQDGATFQAKARIVRYLHERHGFDVLVFESGFYECDRAWRDVLEGKLVPEAAAEAIQPIWTGSAQVQELFAWMQSAFEDGDPLRLAGMDLMPTGKNVGRAAGEIEELARIFGIDEALVEGGLEILAGIAAGGMGEVMRWDEIRRGAAREQIEALRESLLDHAGQGTDELAGRARFLAQVLETHAALLQLLWTADFSNPDGDPNFNLRDAQMAANLLWLVEGPLRAEKILVWGATSHLSRNRQRLQVTTAPGMIPLGHIVARELGAEVYQIGFTAYDGEIGSGGSRTTLEPASEGSLEDLWHATGHELSFLDLNGLPDSGAWLREPLSARPMGYGDFIGPWPEVLDAFVFTSRMTPSEPR